MRTNLEQTVFVVVTVQSGVAVGARCFRSLGDAQNDYESVAQELNLQEDDVQIFETHVT